LRELQRELGVSSLFITHNIGVVECVAEAVAVIWRGRSVETGPVGKVLGHPQEPHARSLLASEPKAPVLARRSLSCFVACDQQSGS
jgi:ABC-type dipeptide/oligopeptide/nickel transport system ATPase component